MRRRISKTSKSFPVRESGLAPSRLGREALESAGCFILEPECRIAFGTSLATVLVRSGTESAVRAALKALGVECGPSVVLWESSGLSPLLSPQAINGRYAAVVKSNRAKGIPVDRARVMARREVDNAIADVREACASRGYGVVMLPVRTGSRSALAEVGSVPGVVGIEVREIGSGSSDSQSHINPNLPRPVGLRRTGFHDPAAIAQDRKEHPPERLKKAPAPSADNSLAALELSERMKDERLSPSGLLAELLPDGARDMARAIRQWEIDL